MVCYYYLSDNLGFCFLIYCYFNNFLYFYSLYKLVFWVVYINKLVYWSYEYG